MLKKLALLTSLLFLLPAAGCLDEDSGLTKPQVSQVLEIQQATQLERADLSRQRDQLETDRRTWAERERRDPILAEAIGKGLFLIACCFPLVLIFALLFTSKTDPSPDFIREVVIEESATTRSKLVEPTSPTGKLE